MRNDFETASVLVFFLLLPYSSIDSVSSESFFPINLSLMCYEAPYLLDMSLAFSKHFLSFLVPLNALVVRNLVVSGLKVSERKTKRRERAGRVLSSGRQVNFCLPYLTIVEPSKETKIVLLLC